MDSGWLDFLKGTSPIAAIIIAAFAVAGLRWARRVIREDNREALGLLEGETLDSKINGAVSDGFSDSVHPLTEAIQGLTRQVSTLTAELAGLRLAMTNHGNRIIVLEMQVAALTGQVGGLPAVHALRSRLERKKAAALDRQFEEKKP